MFKCILVPTDGSATAEKVFAAALEAAKINNGKLIGISVVRPYTHPRPTEGSSIPDYSKAYNEERHRHAQACVQKLADLARGSDVPCDTLTPQATDPSTEIVKAVNQYGCDVIFMGSHGRRGLNKLLMGSEAQRVLAESPVPVMIFR